MLPSANSQSAAHPDLQRPCGWMWVEGRRSGQWRLPRLRKQGGSTLALLVTWFLSLESAPSTAGQDWAQTIDVKEAYAVFASLLQDEWPLRVAHAKQLVFQEETRPSWPCMPSGEFDEEWRTVVDRFRRANARSK